MGNGTNETKIVASDKNLTTTKDVILNASYPYPDYILYNVLKTK